jgi:hypothetical protein
VEFGQIRARLDIFVFFAGGIRAGSGGSINRTAIEACNG